MSSNPPLSHPTGTPCTASSSAAATLSSTTDHRDGCAATGRTWERLQYWPGASLTRSGPSTILRPPRSLNSQRGRSKSQIPHCSDCSDSKTCTCAHVTGACGGRTHSRPTHLPRAARSEGGQAARQSEGVGSHCLEALFERLAAQAAGVCQSREWVEETVLRGGAGCAQPLRQRAVSVHEPPGARGTCSWEMAHDSIRLETGAPSFNAPDCIHWRHMCASERRATPSNPAEAVACCWISDSYAASMTSSTVLHTRQSHPSSFLAKKRSDFLPRLDGATDGVEPGLGGEEKRTVARENVFQWAAKMRAQQSMLTLRG